MRHALGALIGVGGSGRVAQGQCQTARLVESGGLLVQGATDRFVLGRMRGVDVVADRGLAG
jgi:hypothetical protein